MNETQTILIGLGGTGSRAVNNVAKLLSERDIKINDGIVTCLVLDTNQRDNGLIKATGTDIPVIATCDNRTIDGYLSEYATTDPLKWCPYSRMFGADTMIDGASEMRVKSRIAFMATMNQKRTELESALEKVFKNRPTEPDKIRVMIVSSLSGGTGSGMFIQVALWVRQYLESRNCKETIRGIFLLPDVFIRTVENIRRRPRAVVSHYANAYAAIRELNALDKAIREGGSEQPIVIPGLFDSRNPPQKPIYDFAFFIDDEDYRGASLDSIEKYEKMVAQIVYMQLYAPMVDELTSVEDNLYHGIKDKGEPLYGSCGTARAVYPSNDVIEYCALRAAQDSVTKGWRGLDIEIKSMLNEEKNAEKDGKVITNPISIRDTYIRLFDQRSQKSGDQIGLGDKLFVRIRSDVKTESQGRADQQNEAGTTCRAASFVGLIERKIKDVVATVGKSKSLEKNLSDYKGSDSISKEQIDELKGFDNELKTKVKQVMREFDENVKIYADDIIRAFAPTDMGSVNDGNAESLFGLFKRTNKDGQTSFIHPVAARYLLYKLDKKIEENQSLLKLESKQRKAENCETEVSFDNRKTRRVEETLENYWEQTGFYTSRREVVFFAEKFEEYSKQIANNCLTYETARLSSLVYAELRKYVKELIKLMEALFDRFDALNKQFSKDIELNIARNDNDADKTLYVYATREEKEYQYESLGIDLTEKNNDLFAELIKSVYGKFCAQHRPSAEHNAQFANQSVVESFYNAILGTYKEILRKEHKNELKLDIVNALYKESDYKYQKDHRATDEEDEGNDSIFGNDSVQKENKRHTDAFSNCRDRLKDMSTHFLKERPENAEIDSRNLQNTQYDQDNKMYMETADGEKLYVPIQSNLTFWGFNPNISKVRPDISAELSTNTATAASLGYGVDELVCYSSVYGVKAGSVSKFNENGGIYYKNYSAVINSMVNGGSETDTPHIDKTWHAILPYIGRAKQEERERTFYKTLWLAVAYGRIEAPDGKYQLRKTSIDVYGRKNTNPEELRDRDAAIRQTDVRGLVSALRRDPYFELSLPKEMQNDFEEDTRVMVKCSETRVFKGLLANEELNPFSLIIRCALSRDADYSVTSGMIGGLREIMQNIASRHDGIRSEEDISKATVQLLNILYQKCTLVEKEQILSDLVDEFRNAGLPTDPGTTSLAPTSGIDDLI